MVNDVKILSSVLEYISQESGIKEEELRKRSRITPLVSARFKFYYLCKKYNPNLTLMTIGSFLKYDHASVIHGIRCIEDRISIDKPFKKDMENLCKKYLNEVHPVILQKTTVKTHYNEIQSYKREVNRVTRQANKMYYEAMMLINKVSDEINNDNVIEGFRRGKLNNQFLDVRNKLKLLKMGLSE